MLSRGGQELIRGEGLVRSVFSPFQRPPVSLPSTVFNLKPTGCRPETGPSGSVRVHTPGRPPLGAPRSERPNVQLIALSAVQLFQLEPRSFFFYISPGLVFYFFKNRKRVDGASSVAGRGSFGRGGPSLPSWNLAADRRPPSSEQAPDSSPARLFLLEVMGDTSERSKPPSLPPRCPCGFWG